MRRHRKSAPALKYILGPFTAFMYIRESKGKVEEVNWQLH
jgi:hypothetical protein